MQNRSIASFVRPIPLSYQQRAEYVDMERRDAQIHHGRDMDVMLVPGNCISLLRGPYAQKIQALGKPDSVVEILDGTLSDDDARLVSIFGEPDFIANARRLITRLIGLFFYKECKRLF
jgi:hypothetical protein